MRKPSITYEAAVTRAAHNVLIQNSRGVMYVLRMSVTPYFTVCSICSTFSLPFPLSPLSSLLFSFPLISRCPPPPLLYLHVTLISLSTGLWDVCARICVCVCRWVRRMYACVFSVKRARINCVKQFHNCKWISGCVLLHIGGCRIGITCNVPCNPP